MKGKYLLKYQMVNEKMQTVCFVISRVAHHEIKGDTWSAVAAKLKGMSSVDFGRIWRLVYTEISTEAFS